MKNKELEKLIKEYKPKFIYQRYQGRLTKYEIVNDNYLVDVKTGMSIDYKAHLMFGKLSENIIDLIEVGDYVNGRLVTEIKNGIINEISGWFGIDWKESDVKSVVTHEQFANIEYRTGENDE